MSFVHLHNHTHYSILEGLPKPKDYAKKAASLGMKAVAITDTSNIHGCHELYKAAKDEGIKAILGTEIYLQSSLDLKMFHKIVLLAKNHNGFLNILALTSISNLERPGDKPYITFEELKQYSLDIICLSGPISGEISYYILAGFDEEKIVNRINDYIEIFKDDFYLELLYHDDIPKQRLVTDEIIKLHKKYNFKVVATNNCYYINKSDKKTQDVIKALGTGHQIANPDRPTIINGDYSFLDEEEMQELFGFIPESISNTQEIADKVNIKFETGGILIPKYELPESDQKVFEEAIEMERGEYEKIHTSPSPLNTEQNPPIPSPFPPGEKGEINFSYNSFSLGGKDAGKADRGISSFLENTPDYITKLSQDLRKNPTKTEEIMWEILRGKKINGYKFRRQNPFGRYIADFYSDEAKLVIELDGKIHETQKEYDNLRDEIISKYGVKILRFKNEEIIENLDNVISEIIKLLSPFGEKVGIGGLDENHQLNGEEKLLSPLGGKVGIGGIIKKLSSDEWYLRYLSYKGLNWRYGYELTKEQIFELVKKLDVPGLQKKLTESSPEELKTLSLTYYTDKKKNLLETFSKDLLDKIERLEYELVVVHEMGFDAYFLIVADYINRARANDIPVGPGRGSAAGSLMAFLSGITDLDPLPYQLLFERFLNPARVSMPDIDTDFSDDARDKVIDYCRRKYGNDHVAQICTFGTFAARAAVKDVGRVYGIDFAEMNELAKLIPEKPGTKLKGALEESLEFKNAYDTNEKYREIIDNALKIEGNVRQVGVHACAVIIAPNKMTNYTALTHPPKDQNAIITQYSAYPLEDLGLLKMDFLGLRNLTIIQRTLKIIKSRKGIDLNILTVNRDDPNVFKIFAKGDTTGVFQFESDGMRKYLQDLGPDSFEDLIAMVSLYRPGPLAYIPTYIDRKYGRVELKYMSDDLINILKGAGYSDEVIAEEKRKLDEDLAPILDVSNGIAVYQEQLMFIVQVMGGFSLGEADLLRRGIGKKKKEVIEQLKGEFIKKAGIFRNYKPETPKYIYEEMIQPAANYSFNKSHAACYAFIAYQTAYLKAYYEAEFLTSLMVSDEENMERIVLAVGECLSKGINVLPPDINESMKHFTYIDDKTIRFGLKAIKGIGNGPIEAITNGRNDGIYTSLEDFIKRAGKEVINKKSLEALILSGSMDKFGERGQLFKNIENIIRFAKNADKKTTSNQIGLFDDSTDGDILVLEKVNPYTFEEKIFGERQVVGFTISGHPLDGLLRYIEKRSQNAKVLKLSFEEIEKLPEKDKSRNTIVQTIGYVKDIRKSMTKTGGTMTFMYCESFLYDFEITIFPKDYETYKDKIKADTIVLVNGGLNINTEYKRKAILARDIKTLTITQVREQAMSLGIFDKEKYNAFLKNDLLSKKEVVIEEKTTLSKTPPLTPPLQGEGDIEEDGDFDEENIGNDDFVEIVEEKPFLEEEIKDVEKDLYSSEMPEKYVINIPPTAKKEDLLELKSLMMGLEKGDIKIFLNLKGQEIDTKMSLGSLIQIYEFEKKFKS